MIPVVFLAAIIFPCLSLKADMSGKNSVLKPEPENHDIWDYMTDIISGINNANAKDILYEMMIEGLWTENGIRTADTFIDYNAAENKRQFRFGGKQKIQMIGKAVDAAVKIQDEESRCRVFIKLLKILNIDNEGKYNQILNHLIAETGKIKNIYSRADVLKEIADSIASTDIKKTRVIFESYINSVRSVSSERVKVRSLVKIIKSFSKTDRNSAEKLCLEIISMNNNLQEDYSKYANIIEIVKLLPESDLKNSRMIYEKLYTAAENMQDRNSKCNVLKEIADSLVKTETGRSGKILSKALSIAETIPDNYQKNNILKEIADSLVKVDVKKSHEIYLKSLESADKIPDSIHKSFASGKILKSLAAIDKGKAAEIFLKEISAYDKIAGDTVKSKTIINTANAIGESGLKTPDMLYAGLVSSAETIQDGYDKFRALWEVAKNLEHINPGKAGEIYKKSVSAAETIKAEYNKSAALKEITKQIPGLKPGGKDELLKNLVSAADKLVNDADKSVVLSEILTVLSLTDMNESGSILLKVISSFETMQTGYSKSTGLFQTAKALAALKSGPDPEIYERLLSAVKKIPDESLKTQALSEVAKSVSVINVNRAKKIYDEAVTSADAIQNSGNRSLAFTFIAVNVASIDTEKSSEVFLKAVMAAETIKDGADELKVVSFIAESLSKVRPQKVMDLFRKLILITDKIQDSAVKAGYLKDIAKHLSYVNPDISREVFLKAVKETENIQSENFKSAIFTGIIKSLIRIKPRPYREVLSQLITASEKINDDSIKYMVISQLADAVTYTEINEAVQLNNELFKAAKTFNYNRQAVSGKQISNKDEKNIKFAFFNFYYSGSTDFKSLDYYPGIFPSIIKCSYALIDQPAVKYREYLKAVKKTVMAYNSVLRRGPLEPPLVMNVIAGNNILYPSLTFGYGTENLALMRAEFFNPSDKNIKFRLTAKQGEYLDSGKFIYPGVYELKPEEKLIVELPLLLNHAFVLRNKFTKTGFGLTLTAQDAGETGSSQNPAVLASTETEFSVQTANTMEWGSEKKAMQFASFMTVPKEMKDFVKDKMNKIHIEGEEYIFPPLRRAMKIYSILAAMEFNYAPVGIKDDNTDDVYYPVETFMTRSGNCSSLTAMFCALLEDNLVETAYYVTDRHVFTLINTGVRVEGDSVNKLNRYMLSPDTGDLKIIEGSEFYWIPFETTALGYNTKLKRQYSFLEGWKYGVESFQKKPEAIIMTRQAWGSGYRKMLYEITKWREPRWKDSETKEALNLYSNEIKTFRKQKYENALSELRKSAETKRSPGSYIDLGMFYGLNGEYGKAIQWIKKGIELKPTGSGYNGLGNIYMITGKYRESLKQYSAGLEIEGVSVDEKAKLLINLALLYDRKKEALDPNGDELRKVLKRIDSLPEFVREQYRALYDSFMKSVSSRASEVDEDMRNSVLW
jgi:tetratricopeptide (TPR) repeat protein